MHKQCIRTHKSAVAKMYVLDCEVVCIVTTVFCEVWHLQLWAADEMRIINSLSVNSNTSLVFITNVNNRSLFSDTKMFHFLLVI